MRLFRFLIVVLLLPAMASAESAPSTAESAAQKSESEIIFQTLKGQDLIFARRYGQAMEIFDALKRDYPDSPAGDFGTMAALEIEMLEREDFHRESEFLAAAKEAKRKIGLVMGSRDPGKWNLFLAGSILGLDGFFKARKGKWLDSYTDGSKSRQIFRRVKEMDPSFVDADFGLGMYIYWRSVFSRDLWFLRMIPDKRAEGIAIVEKVASEGRFAKEMAGVNLAVMYIEEKRYEDARQILSQYVARYPSNVIFRTMLGKTFGALKRYAEGIAQFRAILKEEPSMSKPHYFIGALSVLSGDKARFDEAERELRSFIEGEKGKYWPASAHYWLGKLAEARGNAELAKQEYGIALALNPDVIEAQKRMRALGGGL